jgi:hypothetical protein
MKVWIRTPYSTEKNLGKAYNEEMDLIPDGDAACFHDGDTMFLTPDYGHIIEQYANAHPDDVLTCWTNRIHQLAVGQLYDNIKSSDIKDHLTTQQGFTTTTEITGPVSGFLLVIPKHIWLLYPFAEENIYRPGELNLLGVDNEWTNKIRRNGIQVLRMDGLYVWHTYRLLSNGLDKSHLK